MKPIPNPWASYDDDVEHMLGKDAYTHFVFKTPKDGYYYVWDEQQGRVYRRPGSPFYMHPSYDKARFARSCSTRWPFLRIYRKFIRDKETVLKEWLGIQHNFLKGFEL